MGSMSTNGTPKAIWPTKPCNRCGGGGKYSWCQMYGDTCFGCSGSGLAFANKKVHAIVNQYREALKAQKESSPLHLAPGTQVYVERDANGNPLAQYRKTGKGEWLAVYEVTADPMQRRNSSRSGHKIDGDDRATTRGDVVVANDMTVSWCTLPTTVVVTYVDGTVECTSANQVVRTFVSGVDPVPYMLRCVDALGKTDRTKARAEYKALLADAGWDLFTEAAAA